MKGIFKFQASQMPYHHDYLVYPEDRYFMMQKKMTEPMEELFLKHGEKFYAEAELDVPSQVFTIGKILEEMPKW